MKSNYLFLILFSLFYLYSGSSYTQNSYSEQGVFLDTLKVGGKELRLGITVQTNDEGNYTASFNSIDQGSGEINFDEVKIEGSRIYLSSKAGIVVEGEYNNEKTKIIADFKQGPFTFPLEFERVEYLPVYSRPQEPKKPYPYVEEEIVYKNEKAGIQLAGTLTLPQGEGPFPAVVLLTGSGPQNRNEELVGHKPFLVLADFLTRNGIAVLRADDRGFGASTGEFKSSTTGDFADDGLAGIEWLKTRTEIDPGTIGFIGHSEGGMMAPIAATKSTDVAFIVLLAGPGSNIGENVNYQRATLAKNNGASDEFVEIQRKVHQAFNEIAKKDISVEQAMQEARDFYAGLSEAEKNKLQWNDDRINGSAGMVLDDWWRYALRYNPEETIGALDLPVLAILGEKDQQVPVALNQEELERALSRGHEKSQLVVMPGLNHLFQTCETGDISEYIKIDETMSPKVLEIIKDWIISLSNN